MPPGRASHTPTLGIQGTARKREHPADLSLRAELPAAVVTPGTTAVPTRTQTSLCSGAMPGAVGVAVGGYIISGFHAT